MASVLRTGKSASPAEVATLGGTPTQRPLLSFWQIWNMSFGFLGIQFGWGLQMANMSPIYKYLGASDRQIPMLWLAAPLTGFIVQPIIGAMSDRTWGPLGRRRPYFLVGAILSSLALVAMPNCSALWMAAGLLWILDASINVSMEPFRAFVADKLPEEQRGTGFAMQSFFIGVGAVIAGLLPYVLRGWFHVSSKTGAGNAIPQNVKIAFYTGAVAFLGAVLWTIFSTPEYPPEDMEAFRRKKSERSGLAHLLHEIPSALREMPSTMRRLAFSACGCTSRMPSRLCSARAIPARTCSNAARNGPAFVTRGKTV